MKILEKIRKINVLCLIVSIIGAIILLVMFEQAIIKLDNIPIFKTFKEWNETIHSILDNTITKKDYQNSVINKHYTYIEDSDIHSIINEEKRDLLISYDPNDIVRFPAVIYPEIKISEFVKNQLNNVTSIKSHLIKGQYVYIDNKWYINNYYITKLTRNESILEIKEIINSINEHTIKQKQIQNSWTNITTDSLDLIDATEIRISGNENGYIVDGTDECKNILFNFEGKKIKCTKIQTKDGSTKKVSFIYKDSKNLEYKKIIEEWTLRNDNESIRIQRPNGYIISQINSL